MSPTCHINNDMNFSKSVVWNSLSNDPNVGS